MTSGFVLAGGASRRMGTNKALLPFGGTTLVQHVSNQVAEATRHVYVIGPREHLGDLKVPVIDDLFPGEGPLGAIVTALTFSFTEWNLVVACDMPSVTSEMLRTLFHHAVQSECDALVPATSDGRRHPLCAVYRTTALPGLRAAWSGGLRRVYDALDRIRTEYLPCGRRAVTNVNTPAEWEAYGV